MSYQRLRMMDAPGEGDCSGTALSDSAPSHLSSQMRQILAAEHAQLGRATALGIRDATPPVDRR